MDYYFLGEEELVTAFRLIGIQGMAIKNGQEAVAVFRWITEGLESPAIASGVDSSLPDLPSEAAHCQVLILTEETADWLGDFLTNWQLTGRYPLLVEIPGIGGKLPGRKTLVELIREAIGVHV
jgi:V/A-type H+-transporting ATPase subunit F